MENEHLIVKLAEKLYSEEKDYGLTWYEALKFAQEIIEEEGESYDING